MTSRLIILVLGIIFFSFGFYLLSYQKNFNQQKPLNMNFAEETFKTFNETTSLHGESNHEKIPEVAKEIVIDLEKPSIKRAYELFHNVGKCASCHGDQAQGLKEKSAPLLAAQEEWYTVSQLLAFQNGSRVNEAMMPFIKDLTEQDFKDLAEYISLLRIKP